MPRVLLVMGLLITVMCDRAVAARKINLIEVFAQSNEPSCINFTLEGLSTYIKASFSLFGGVSFEFIVSPTQSHFNPDFVVTSYPRLGDSPSLENFILFGAQNYLSFPVLKLLSGYDFAPGFFNHHYKDRKKWAGVTSEYQQAQENKSTVRYFEVEVTGHPGNLFTIASDVLQGRTQWANAAQTQAALVTAVQSTGSNVSQGIQQVGEVGEGLEDVAEIPAWADMSGVFRPVQTAAFQVVANVLALIDDLPGRLQTVIVDEISESVEQLAGPVLELGGVNVQQTIGDAVDHLVPQAPLETCVRDECEPRPPPPAEPGPTPAQIANNIADTDWSALPESIREGVVEHFQGLTPQQIVAEFGGDLGTDLVALVETLETIQSITDVFSGNITAAPPGLSPRTEDWQGFCPRDTQVLVPYYLSGLNVLGWRYKIPELVYPRTYYPAMSSMVIGHFSLNPLAFNNYGSAWPRNGYIMQSDEVKAAAVAAFRAAHVVTRPGQMHLYRHAANRSYEDMEMRNLHNFNKRNRVNVLEPDDEQSGRWQMVSGGDPESSCHRFGDPAVNPPAPLLSNLLNGSATVDGGWTAGKASDDNSYVFSLWRQYRCNPRPQGRFVWEAGFIDLPDIELLQ